MYICMYIYMCYEILVRYAALAHPGSCLAVEEDANTDTAAVKLHLADAAVETHIGKRLCRAPVVGLPVLESIDDLSKSCFTESGPASLARQQLHSKRRCERSAHYSRKIDSAVSVAVQLCTNVCECGLLHFNGQLQLHGPFV